jgi:exopolyphosphatase/guanosine-5'-triphosphate,3'-diphosphate pyrophosphatase
MKIAAIDIGANSVHLVVSRLYGPGVHEVLDRSREMLRLGEATFSTGAIPPREMRRTLEVLKRFRSIAEAHGVEAVLAVATSAVRDARNRDDFVRRAEREARLAVRVLSGEEEGRLIYLGVRDAIALTLRRIAVIDIGGGSAEVVIGDGREILSTRCLKLGALRLAVRFSGSRKRAPLLEKHIRGEIGAAAKEVERARVDAVIGTSGTILTVADLLGVREDGGPIRLEALETLSEKLLAASPRQLKQMPSVRDHRADTIGPGAQVVLSFMREAGVEEILVCERALREGVVADYALRNASRLEIQEAEIPDPRRRSVHFVARRLGALDLHARQTARLALRLFDGLGALHGLGPGDRELLEYAALLHDAGYWIGAEKHHKHAFYLIREAPLEGFTRNEVEIIALVARYHRGASPRERHAAFSKLTSKAQERVRSLSALLRIADGLDRSHCGLVRDVAVRLRRGAATVEIDVSGDPDLELHAAGRRSNLFQKVFSREIRFKTGSRRNGKP